MQTDALLAFLGLGLAELLLILFVLSILLGGTALWVVALADIARHDFRTNAQKITWIVLVAFTHFVGALLYFLVGREQRVHRA